MPSSTSPGSSSGQRARSRRSRRSSRSAWGTSRVYGRIVVSSVTLIGPSFPCCCAERNEVFRSIMTRGRYLVQMESPDTRSDRPLSGRRAQARRNDPRIREAAREVFTRDPEAPMSAVAARAGVGISALYRRYASKEDLLRQVARDGLAQYLEEAEVAAADERDAWTAFVAFMERLLDAQTVAITMNLAGTFAPSEELYLMSVRAAEL